MYDRYVYVNASGGAGMYICMYITMSYHIGLSEIERTSSYVPDKSQQ